MKFYKTTALSLAALLSVNYAAFAGSCMSSNRNTWEEAVVPQSPSKAQELITLIAKNPNTDPKEKGVRISKIITSIAPGMAEQALAKTPTPFDYENFLNKLAAAKFDSDHPQFKKNYLPTDLLGLILSYLKPFEIQTLMQTSNVIEARITKELNSWDKSHFRFVESLAYIKSASFSKNPSNLEQINMLCTIVMDNDQKGKPIAEKLVLLSKEELGRLNTSIFELKYSENNNNKILEEIVFLDGTSLKFTSLIPKNPNPEQSSEEKKDWYDPTKYYSITAQNLPKQENIQDILSKSNVLALKLCGYDPMDLVNLLKETAENFEKTQYLKALDLSGCNVSVISLLNALHLNISIEKLNLTRTFLMQPISNIVNLLRNNHTIKDLNLSNNQLFGEDINDFASIISTNKTLTTLDLSNCFTYDKDFILILNALSKNDTLQNIYLLGHPSNDNPLNQNTIGAFLEMLKNNRSLRNIYLSELKTLNKAIQQNSTLEGLYVYNPHTKKFDNMVKKNENKN